MISRILLLFSLFALLPAGAQISRLPSKLGPEHVVVVYNANVPGSMDVAEAYMKARQIPANQVLKLECPTGETISREEFAKTIEDPLRRAFSNNQWWQLASTSSGVQALDSQIRAIVPVYGVPLRIKRDATLAKGKKDQAAMNEASVDSELALLGVLKTSRDAALTNPYFRKKEDFIKFRSKALFIVTRLDGPNAEVSKRIAVEAVEAEKQGGPWGRAAIDLSGYHPLGDEWMRKIYSKAWDSGVPAQIDRHKWSYPSHYPFTDVALYFGWYEMHRNGFLLDPSFRFAKGAVAVHLHSFSAQTLRSTSKHWVGPLLAAGATASLGNVWEPYLQLSHHFDIFADALLDGYTFGEASLMSTPVVSWMGVAVGDPLYRPFGGRSLPNSERFEGGGFGSHKAIMAALIRWKKDPEKCASELRRAGGRMRTGILVETAGLLAYRNGDYAQAEEDFEEAGKIYAKEVDKLRCGMLISEVMLARKEKGFAVKKLKELEKEYAKLPQIKAVQAQVKLLLPPPKPKPKAKAGAKKSG